MLDERDEVLTGRDRVSFDGIMCSLFSTNANPANRILGRNFDNPQNDVLLTRYNPPVGYASLAFTRMSDLGYAYGTNFDGLTFEQKLPLLRSAYFVPDGINETGLAAGLAAVDPMMYTIDPAKDTIFITRLIREILDHAETLEEAENIANSYNVFDSDIHVISHHLLVGTPTEGSVTLEYNDGAFRVVTPDVPWQVLTNIPVYNVPNEILMNGCWRYASLYDRLEEHEGEMDWQEGLNALEEVHVNCPWSVIYDLNNMGIYIAVHNNYEDIAYTDLETFSFTIYVGLDENKADMNLTDQLLNYPNPFRLSTTIDCRFFRDGHTEICIYDCHGMRIRTLIDGTLPAGEYKLKWDGCNDSGNRMVPGIYWCVLQSGNQQSILKMVLIAR